ncbi:MAG: TIGR04133 family radical SAM/SPASM protein [Spirochaetaceae bacterium]|jgi:radical SAM enzyme (rSAM/lipoprotein system)|nr:TIGR04133 family radical SAM/SPASM protein [Spirochaetaceae bacterium]
MPNKFSQLVFRQFRKNEIKLHELTYLFWECTRRCNLRCLHCGSDCGADAETQDMPFEDFLKAILPLKDAYKNITVVITGGEPLLRDDLARCGRALRERGFRWGVVTNGYAYTPETHRRLIAAGMGAISLSLDGFEQTHNRLRGNPRSFQRAVSALELIASSKRLCYDVVTCVHQNNISDLEAFRAFLISKRAGAWRLFTIAPIGRAAGNDALQLNPEQLKKLMDFIVYARSDRRMKVTFSCEAYLGGYEGKVRDGYFFCRAGIQIASVLADGSISACPNIDRSFAQGSIYTDSLLDVWNSRFAVMRDRRWMKTGLCADCSAFGVCGGGAMHLRNKKTSIPCIHSALRIF